MYTHHHFVLSKNTLPSENTVYIKIVQFARMSILQKISDIESEMARTQKNKATSAHLGLLKGNYYFFKPKFRCLIEIILFLPKIFIFDHFMFDKKLDS